jgi:hypothetical protein
LNHITSVSAIANAPGLASDYWYGAELNPLEKLQGKLKIPGLISKWDGIGRKYSYTRMNIK